MLLRVCRNAGFDQVKRAVKSSRKKLFVQLFAELLFHYSRMLAFTDHAEIHQSDGIAVFIRFGPEHAADGDGHSRG